MGLHRRRPAAAASAGPSVRQVDPEVRLQARWTGGSQLATRAATVGLWLALICGPVALLLAVSVGAAAGTPIRPAAAPADPAGERAAVEEFAQRFVVAWLQTPRGQEAQLQAYITAAALTLPEQPFTAADPATANVAHVAAGVWAVTVAVTVTTPAQPTAATTPPSPNTPASTSTRRYFQVPVNYTAGALVAAALPAPTAAPATAAAPRLAYRNPGPLSGPLAASVQGFLTALLTGNGDVTRYSSPGTAIAAVTPPPYTAVTVNDLMVDRDLAGLTGQPAAGDQVRLLATATATAGPKQAITVQYALTLLARAGRWEVKAVDATPESTP